MRLLVVARSQVVPRTWRRGLVVANGCRTCRFAIARPPIESLLRRGFVVALRRAVLAIRSVPIGQARVVTLGGRGRGRLVVGVPLLLVVVRHTVLVGQVRVIGAVLWFQVTTSAAADVIATGRVVIISVWLLVWVVRLLGVVRPRLHTMARSPWVFHYVWILLEHLWFWTGQSGLKRFWRHALRG
jgi:hypothetical protein